ncbi:GntR family transcriptional regulator [Candidatus Bipolaricaulota bacterium]|nr:GntR family transcriptional regulator [Candidatus Bipolaricaulota bacterium]
MTITRRSLVDQVADDIMEQILSGTLPAGRTLPTEPTLARQYGVGRNVVHDAIRLLAARGLVEVKHGRGVFVTTSQRRVVADTLYLALRRAEATVWDLEEFERVLFPAAVSMAIERATPEDIKFIRTLAQQYIEDRRVAIASGEALMMSSDTDPTIRAAMASFGEFLRAVYSATHNEVFVQFAELLIELRSWREWTQLDPQEDLKLDVEFFDVLLAALESRDPHRAEDMLRSPYQHLPGAIESMKQTPIGDIVRILP